MKNILKISSVFVGTVIGAGFATGAELVQYYVRFGRVSLWALIASCVLFGVLCAVVLCKIYWAGAVNFESYFKEFDRPLLIKIFGYIITIFMFACFCIMLAASGAAFKEQLGLPYWSGVAVLCVICSAAFIAGAKGLVAINTVITPVMLTGIVFLGIYVFFNSHVPVFATEKFIDNIAFSSLVYISYNSLALIVVMTAVHEYVDSRKTALCAAALGGGVLCVGAVILWLILFNFNVTTSEIPILSILKSVGGIGRTVYFPVLYIAIITTALANGFGVAQSFGVNIKVTGVLISIAGALVSYAGFSTLIVTAYGFFGWIGIPVIFITLFDGVKYLKY